MYFGAVRLLVGVCAILWAFGLLKLVLIWLMTGNLIEQLGSMAGIPLMWLVVELVYLPIVLSLAQKSSAARYGFTAHTMLLTVFFLASGFFTDAGGGDSSMMLRLVFSYGLIIAVFYTPLKRCYGPDGE